MLTELCAYLKNWFNRKPDGENYPVYEGDFTIADGVITFAGGEMDLLDGQYFRIMGSRLNDGVNVFAASGQASETALVPTLQDETFSGTVWTMAIPRTVIDIAKEIVAWKESAGGPANNLFNSENLSSSAYSYTAKSAEELSGINWQTVFSKQLAPWRKL